MSCFFFFFLHIYTGIVYKITLRLKEKCIAQVYSELLLMRNNHALNIFFCSNTTCSNTTLKHQSLRGLRGRHPLCGTGVLSVIDTTRRPPIFKPWIAAIRPGPSPFTTTRTNLTPLAMDFAAAEIPVV